MQVLNLQMSISAHFSSRKYYHSNSDRPINSMLGGKGESKFVLEYAARGITIA